MMQQLLRCARLCKASYDDSDSRFITVNDLRFGVIDGVLVFRGTANGHNALRDLTAIPARSIRGYLAHRGFVQAVRDVWDDVIHAVYPGVTEVAGHSLGGAMALLAAEALRIQAITFGCPRVYWRWGARPLGVDHRRVTCDDDPVPMVPRLMYMHCDPPAPLVLKDDDHRIIDVRDHGIDTYIARLEKCVG